MRTSESQRLTLVQGGAGEGVNSSALSIFGPVSRGLTTLQTTRPQLRTESLNDLVKTVDDLVSRYLEVSDILITATEALVRRGRGGSSTTITEEDSYV